MPDHPLPREFFRVDAPTLAVRLIGCRMARRLPGGEVLRGLIVETEAYTGVRDRASHAFGGRRTARNEAMYARAGTAYVYFTYGMHFCMNVVCGEVNDPSAVLLRALEPLHGIETMRTARATRSRPNPAEADLCSGPGKLCRALSIGREENGLDLTLGEVVWIEGPPDGWVVPPLDNTARIGLSIGGVWAKRRLRWHIRDHPHVSA